MTTPAARRRPAGRYDEPSLLGQRVLAVLLGTLFLGLVTAAAFSLYDRYGSPDVTFQAIGYDVTGDDEVVVDFEIAAAPGEPVTCVVRARNRAGAEVAREVVEVGAVEAGERTLRVQHALATSDRAVTGEVQRCALTSALPRQAD